MTVLYFQGELNIEPLVAPLAYNDPRVLRGTALDTTYSRTGWIDDNYGPVSLTGQMSFIESSSNHHSKQYWMHFATQTYSTHDSPRAYIKDESGRNVYMAFMDGKSVSFTAYNESGTGTTVLASFAASDHVNMDVDVLIDVPNDSVSLYRNGGLLETIAINLKQIPETYPLTTFALYINTGGVDMLPCMGQLIITEGEPTIGWKVKSLAPSSDGTFNDWIGTYANIDETGLSSSDGLDIDAAGVSTFGYTDIDAGLQTDMVVHRVAVTNTATAATGTFNPNVTNVYYNGTTEYALGASKNVELDNYQSANVDYLSLNPATGQPWTFEEINAAEFGVRSS